jgi:hypothetical protein
MPETLLDQKVDQRVNYSESVRNTVAALFTNGLTVREIETETGVKQATIRTWINRFRLQQTKEKARQALKSRNRGVLAVIEPARKAIPGVSGRLRGVLSRELEAQVAVLERKPPESLLELKNTPEREGRASMVKRIAETAALVENWEDQHAPGIVVMLESMTPPEEQERSIEASATVDMLPADPAAEAIRALRED